MTFLPACRALSNKQNLPDGFPRVLFARVALVLCFTSMK